MTVPRDSPSTSVTRRVVFTNRAVSPRMPKVAATTSMMDPSMSWATAGTETGRAHPVIMERALRKAPRMMLPTSARALSRI